MKRSAFLVIAALVCLVFGLSLWIRPVHMMFMFHVGLDPSGILMGRMLGICLISFAAIFLLARKSPDSPAMSAILWGGLLQNVLTALLVYRMMNRGWMISTAWSIIIVDLLLAVGFLICLSKKTV